MLFVDLTWLTDYVENHGGYQILIVFLVIALLFMTRSFFKARKLVEEILNEQVEKRAQLQKDHDKEKENLRLWWMQKMELNEKMLIDRMDKEIGERETDLKEAREEIKSLNQKIAKLSRGSLDTKTVERIIETPKNE